MIVGRDNRGSNPLEGTQLMTLFFELTIAIIIAAGSGILFHILKQPAIIGFIVAGLVIGSLGYFADNYHIIDNLASIGVAFLLFIVGLELNIRELKHIGKAALLVGLGQIIFTFGIGLLIALGLGFNLTASFYISIALTFSSTIIVVKLLSEKKTLRSLYGRIVLGSLLVQDLVAILILLFLTEFAGKEGFMGIDFLFTLFKAAAFIFIILIGYKYLPKLLDLIGRSQELLFLFSVAWALGIAALASSRLVGLSIEVGGFLAGLALAGSSENFQIGSRLRPLRDFFIILFFVGLGANMLVGASLGALVPVIAFSLFVLIGNPLIILIIMGLIGYRSRTSFLSGLTFAQISEFSFIIAAVGYRLGHLGSPEVSLITLVGIVTIFISSYFISYGERIYELVQPGLRFFERKRGSVEEIGEETNLSDHIVLVGVHRMGYAILRSLSNSTNDFVAVDFDPTVVKYLREHKLPVFYGDINEETIQEQINLDKAKVIISTIPTLKDNLEILRFIRERNSKAKVIITAEAEREGLELYNEGADYVILPHFLGGRELVDIIETDRSFASLGKLKERDLEIIGGSRTKVNY